MSSPRGIHYEEMSAEARGRRCCRRGGNVDRVWNPHFQSFPFSFVIAVAHVGFQQCLGGSMEAILEPDLHAADARGRRHEARWKRRRYRTSTPSTPEIFQTNPGSSPYEDEAAQRLPGFRADPLSTGEDPVNHPGFHLIGVEVLC